MTRENKTGAEADPAGATLGSALRRAYAAVADDFADRFGPENIRPGQFGVLTLLRRIPGLRQNEISAALGIQRTNMAPILHDLELRDLVLRREVPGDRRAAALFLTEMGAATLARLDVLASAHEQKFAARLGPGGRQALLGLLARVADPSLDPP